MEMMRELKPCPFCGGEGRGHMRKVKAWLVTEVTDWGDALVDCPMIAFQCRDMAEMCKDRRDARAEGAEYPTWHEIHEIEVVLDD